MHMSMSSITLIVALDQQRGIGIGNAMPWHLPEDFAHFKRTTSGHPIIMGRKTFESIGRPLPQRRNIVISRNRAWHAEGVEVFASLEAACAAVAEQDSFIIGGADIYRQAITLADRLIVTEIAATYPCDAFFPIIDLAHWQVATRDAHYAETQDLHYQFVTYTKKF